MSITANTAQAASPHPPRFAWSPLPVEGRESADFSLTARGTFSQFSLPLAGRGDHAKHGGWGEAPGVEPSTQALEGPQ